MKSIELILLAKGFIIIKISAQIFGSTTDTRLRTTLAIVGAWRKRHAGVDDGVVDVVGDHHIVVRESVSSEASDCGKIQESVWDTIHKTLRKWAPFTSHKNITCPLTRACTS